jgi:hypothetical protein
MYVAALTGSSLQGHKDIQKVRDALGIPKTDIDDEALERLSSFFAARNEIAHELDLVDSTGRGSSSRRDRTMAAVRDQCDEVLTDFGVSGSGFVSGPVTRSVRAGTPEACGIRTGAG